MNFCHEEEEISSEEVSEPIPKKKRGISDMETERETIALAREQLGARALRGVITICMKHIEAGVAVSERKRAKQAVADMQESLHFRQKVYEKLGVLTCRRCGEVYNNLVNSNCVHCPYYKRCYYGLCESCNPEFAGDRDRTIAAMLWCDACDSPCCKQSKCPKK